ncbi:hypothetical protein D5S17_27510 [Pseudonocardiaceae bacterium YIM PH 21723]|nr:hypothetical protein D5S17_27510 [Pseudonocardiaceae bacterium YIM PH 21723]
MPTLRNNYEYLFCGAGPAGLGPIIAAARLGRLEYLLDKGIILADPAGPGGGGMPHYRISANSLGGAFLECLDDLQNPVFTAVREHPETRRLRELSAEHPPLPLVGRFLDRLGAAIGELVAAHPRCAVLRAPVERIRLTEDGLVDAQVGGEQVRARRAVLALGGRPMDGYRRAEVRPGLSLAAHQHKVCHAEALIDDRQAPPAELLAAIRDTGRVVVLGGSHSAWAAAGLLLSDGHQVTLIHRTPVQLYYPSAEQAHAEGYPFDPVADICSMSGRVNRYGGLRGAARDLAIRTLRDGGPIRLLQAGGPANEALAEAGAIVAATGYQAILPPIEYPDGGELLPALSETGTVVTGTGHLVDSRGTAHPRLIAFGLGAGLAVAPEIGGEPSFTRRAVGIWLYHHDIGRTILDELLTPAEVR